MLCYHHLLATNESLCWFDPLPITLDDTLTSNPCKMMSSIAPTDCHLGQTISAKLEDHDRSQGDLRMNTYVLSTSRSVLWSMHEPLLARHTARCHGTKVSQEWYHLVFFSQARLLENDSGSASGPNGQQSYQTMIAH